MFITNVDILKSFLPLNVHPDEAGPATFLQKANYKR